MVNELSRQFDLCGRKEFYIFINPLVCNVPDKMSPKHCILTVGMPSSEGKGL